MAKKRPCGICRRWFEPHPRAGDRQAVCCAPACQRERHRRSCAAWHDENPGYATKRRLTKAIGADAATPPEPALDDVDWRVVEAAIGPAHRAVAEGMARLILQTVRDAVATTMPGEPSESNGHAGARSRDAVPTGRSGDPDESRGLPHPSRRETKPAKGRRPP